MGMQSSPSLGIDVEANPSGPAWCRDLRQGRLCASAKVCIRHASSPCAVRGGTKQAAQVLTLLAYSASPHIVWLRATRDAPACRRSSASVTLVAIWSRSESAASGLLPLVKDFAPGARALSGEDGLAAVLSDPDVDAIAIVLPAHVQLQVRKKQTSHPVPAAEVGPEVAHHDHPDLAAPDDLREAVRSASCAPACDALHYCSLPGGRWRQARRCCRRNPSRRRRPRHTRPSHGIGPARTGPCGPWQRTTGVVLDGARLSGGM